MIPRRSPASFESFATHELKGNVMKGSVVDCLKQRVSENFGSAQWTWACVFWLPAVRREYRTVVTSRWPLDQPAEAGRRYRARHTRTSSGNSHL